jgi:outer membrane protein W
MSRACLVAVAAVLSAGTVRAQEHERLFAGALVGISTLSADGRSVVAPTGAALSLYKPENGLALNLFAGVHVARFFSLQANYMWNRNDLTLVSSFATADGGGFYEQRRRSTQHAVVADALVYFRGLDSAIRPYLGTGLSVVRFDSRTVDTSVESNLAAPAVEAASRRIALRSAVGIDVALSRHVRLRYSFSETLSGNPISPQLTPAGQRGLANFQNLFGIVARF